MAEPDHLWAVLLQLLSGSGSVEAVDSRSPWVIAMAGAMHDCSLEPRGSSPSEG